MASTSTVIKFTLAAIWSIHFFIFIIINNTVYYMYHAPKK